MTPTAESIKELKKKIFSPCNSNDKFIGELSFLSKCRPLSSEQPASTSDDMEVPDLTSMFMIDSTGSGGCVVGEMSVSKDKTSKKDSSDDTQSMSQLDRQALIKELSHVPTELQVPPPETDLKKTKSKEPEIMKKSVIGPDFEKRHTVPLYSEGKKALARKRRQEKATTKAGWFDMKAPEMTDELEADLEAMQMRGSAASWTGYKKNDYKNGPKFFQIATVQDSPLDFYNDRVPKKARKRTIVDELLADAEFRKTNKKMYVKAVEKLNKRHPNKKGGRHKKAKA